MMSTAEKYITSWFSRQAILPCFLAVLYHTGFPCRIFVSQDASMSCIFSSKIDCVQTRINEQFFFKKNTINIQSTRRFLPLELLKIFKRLITSKLIPRVGENYIQEVVDDLNWHPSGILRGN